MDLRSQLPGEVRAGLALLEQPGIVFAPVRHHSPACALALRSLIREVRPAAVLVEGPAGFDALLPLLLDEGTKPPVAILAQGPDGASAFFPFCDYSPEWVALREGQAAGARLAFIDLPWHARQSRDGASDEDLSLMSERHLAHSRYVASLAARAGCRDHNELWDRLFELRPPGALRDWRTLFADVFCYCAMARAGYEEAVLEAEGSLARERHMAGQIARWRREVEGTLLVVTGGFHTIALQQMLAQGVRPIQPTQPGHEQWLIRYSFDRLDSLNGYGAGMPAPGYYQRTWESACRHDDGPHLEEVALDCLAGLAQRSRKPTSSQHLSTADVQAALLQASRLAALRGHAGPGRQDLLDAIRSCFVKNAVDEGGSALERDVRAWLAGTALGEVAASAGAPPLLADARRAAAACGIRVDDSAARTVRLDLYRSERHRQRSRFLHLMSYLNAGLARWETGPDFIGGAALDAVTEQWRVAWTPVVEARLIDLSRRGVSLHEVALAMLREEQGALVSQGEGRSAGQAAALLVRACLIGLQQQAPMLLDQLGGLLEEDADLESVTACAQRLLTLWQAQEPLGVTGHPGVHRLLLRAHDSALYLLPSLAAVEEGLEAKAIDTMLALRALNAALAHPETSERWLTQLDRLADAAIDAPGVRSAALCLLYLDGSLDASALAHRLGADFGPGAAPEAAVRSLSGLMAAAPELLLAEAALRESFEAILAGWDEATFLFFLPDLRQAFARLRPLDTARLARQLAIPAGALAAGQPLTQQAMLTGAHLNAALAQVLERDGLAAWGTP